MVEGDILGDGGCFFFQLLFLLGTLVVLEDALAYIFLGLLLVIIENFKIEVVRFFRIVECVLNW